MVNGISGSNKPWSEVSVNYCSVSDQAVEGTHDKSEAAPVDQFDTAARPVAGDNITAGVSLPDKAPSGSIVGRIAGMLGFDVDVNTADEVSLPTTSKEMKKWAASLGLGRSQQKEAAKAFDAVANNEAAKKALLNIMQGTSFVEGSAEFQDAVLAFAQQYPNEDVINNIGKISTFDWFAKLSPADSQRACRFVAVLSKDLYDCNVTDDNYTAYNALARFLNGSVPLEFGDTSVLCRVDDNTGVITINRNSMPGVVDNLSDYSRDFARQLAVEFYPTQLFYYDACNGDWTYSYINSAIKELAADEGYNALSRADKKAYLSALVNSNGSASMAENLSILVNDSNYRDMKASVRSQFLKDLIGNGSPVSFHHAKTMLAADWFKALPESEKPLALQTVMAFTAAAEARTNLDERAQINNTLLSILDGDYQVDFSAAGDSAKLSGQTITLGRSLFADKAKLAAAVGQVSANVAAISYEDVKTALEGLVKDPAYCQLAANLQNMVLEAVKCATPKDQPAMVAELQKLVNAKSFRNLDFKGQLALVFQCNYFPNSNSVHVLNLLSSADWYKNSSLEDQQRAAKSLAFMAETAQDKSGTRQATLLNNTMTRILGGQIPITYVEMDDDPNSITLGYAKDATSGIFINKDLVPAGNDPVSKSGYFREVVLDTTCHEVSHIVNGDVNEATYKYYQAEYRAWYLGQIGLTGKVPTRQQALNRSLQIFNLYPNINAALFAVGSEESQKILAFINSIMGSDAKPATNEEIFSMLAKSVKNRDSEAPAPDAVFQPDLDN